MLNNTQTYSDMWQNCLDRIKAQTSEEEFVKWFQPIVPLEFDGTTLRLRVPNESYVRQIEKNYIPFLKPIISQLYGQQTRLHYAVPRAYRRISLAAKIETAKVEMPVTRFSAINAEKVAVSNTAVSSPNCRSICSMLPLYSIVSKIGRKINTNAK